MRISDWSSDVCSSDLRTIIKVASEIVKQQEDFFRHGVAHLKPLTLKTVAEAIEMHESTVSRVTSNKYLSCARGLYELKYFFTSGIQSSDGGEAVRSEEHTSELQSLMRISYAVFCLKKKKKRKQKHNTNKIKNNRLTIYQQRITTNN